MPSSRLRFRPQGFLALTITLCVALTSLASRAQPIQAASPTIVISQVHGGGNAGAPSNTIAASTVCGDPYTAIPTIQGSGAASPLVNSSVTIEGIVTGDFQGTSALNGFFVQDPAGDSNPATSDGIFVFIPSANPLAAVELAVGDHVRLSGTVKEFNSLTEIDSVTALNVCASSSAIASTPVDLPEPVNGDLERVEGMLVTFPVTFTVAQNYFLGRYGQLTLAAGDRLVTPTNAHRPGSPEAIALADANARRLLVLDDGKSSQNPNPIPYIGADNTIRAGDTTSNLTGVLDFGPISSSADVRDYRLHPTTPPSFSRANERTAAPAPVGGNLKVASFNVLNYFTTEDQRGANSPTEFERQRAKIVAALSAIDADIVGLIEIENNGPVAIQNLVDALNEAMGANTYAAIADPASGVGGDEIKVALIYKPARVTPLGPSRSSTDPIFDRFPVAQTFQRTATGATFSVVVNHFKSKGSCPSSTSDPNADQGDGQGCWNAKRVQQAQALLGFVTELQAAANDPDVLVIGDLNAYGEEDPIVTLEAGGLVDQIARFVANPYSYVFDGQAGYLDHALTTASLSMQVSGVTEWHINADEPSVLDYNTEFKPQDLYTPTPYRSSDHDPVIIGLDLSAAPMASAAGPYHVPEGGTVALTATGSDPDEGALVFAWDLNNDGSFETAGQNVSFAAALDGPMSQTIAVRVTDAGGLVATDQTTVTVHNVAPEVNAINAPAGPVLAGAPVDASATFSDPGAADTHSAIWDWGDGNSSTGSIDAGTVRGSHSYTHPGAYTIKLTVEDDDGASTTVVFEKIIVQAGKLQYRILLPIIVR